MKVLSLGNMASDGLLTTMALRKVGVNAELVVNSVDFACALPFWELGDHGRNLFDNEMDPNSLNLKDGNYNMPKWIKILDLNVNWRNEHIKEYLIKDSFIKTVYDYNKKKTPVFLFKNSFVFAMKYLKVRNIITNYDIIEAHVPYPLYLQFINKPYIIYEAGWMGTLTDNKNNKAWITKTSVFRAYKKAKCVINTNPYLDKPLNEFKVNHTINFIPFAIDTDRYKPMKSDDVRDQLTKDNEYLVLGMARQNWDVKGSDKLIQGFYLFHKRFPKSRLLLMKWGPDLKKSIDLIFQLGISNNVSWLPFMPKSKLILIYNAVDIVCDQFIIGGWGTSYPECMATGTPVLLYHENIDTTRFFGSLPPTPSVRTAEDIYEGLIMYKNGKNKFSNQDNRDWIYSTHNMKKIGNMHKEVLQEVLN